MQATGLSVHILRSCAFSESSARCVGCPLIADRSSSFQFPSLSRRYSSSVGCLCKIQKNIQKTSQTNQGVRGHQTRTKSHNLTSLSIVSDMQTIIFVLRVSSVLACKIINKLPSRSVEACEMLIQETLIAQHTVTVYRACKISFGLSSSLCMG